MAELFSDFADFKLYVGGRVNQSVELDSLATSIYEAARRHITPYLSVAQYEGLLGGSLSGAQTALLPFVKRPLALLTLYEYSKVAGVEFGESGMHRIESETRKAAFRYQEKAYQEDCLEKGYEALEILIRFLDDNKGMYTAWAATDEGVSHRGRLLNYASDFRQLTSHMCDRYTFEALRPIIGEVEAFGVEQQLPAAFWAGFKARHMAGSLTTAEKQLRTYMRQAMSHKAMEEATKAHWVRIGQGRVYLTEEFGEQNQYNRTTPNNQVGGLYITHTLWADRHTKRWKSYMTGNPASFPTAFDTDSDGTSTDADAWHINTTDEQETINCAIIAEKKRPIYGF